MLQDVCLVFRTNGPYSETGRKMRKKYDTNQNENIIRDYGNCLEKYSTEPFYDIDLLPHKKEKIFRALIWAITIADNDEFIEAASNATLSLSMFQPDVGESMISLRHDNDLDIENPEEIAAIQLAFAKFQKLSAAQIEEDERTMRQINQAKSINKMRRHPEVVQKRPFWRRFFS